MDGENRTIFTVFFLLKNSLKHCKTALIHLLSLQLGTEISRTPTTCDSFCCSLPSALSVLILSSLLLACELLLSESLGLTTSILVSVSCLDTVC